MKQPKQKCQSNKLPNGKWCNRPATHLVWGTYINEHFACPACLKRCRYEVKKHGGTCHAKKINQGKAKKTKRPTNKQRIEQARKIIMDAFQQTDKLGVTVYLTDVDCSCAALAAQRNSSLTLRHVLQFEVEQKLIKQGKLKPKHKVKKDGA